MSPAVLQLGFLLPPGTVPWAEWPLHASRLRAASAAAFLPVFVCNGSSAVLGCTGAGFPPHRPRAPGQRVLPAVPSQGALFVLFCVSQHAVWQPGFFLLKKITSRPSPQPDSIQRVFSPGQWGCLGHGMSHVPSLQMHNRCLDMLCSPMASWTRGCQWRMRSQRQRTQSRSAPSTSSSPTRRASCG